MMVATRYPTKNVRVSEPVHKRLETLQSKEEEERRRQVPFTELIERLVDFWEENHE